jgi:transcriptional regulator with XRE-family HTH domain
MLQVCHMPRPPSVAHPLRTARKMLGFSQRPRAELVGTSTITLQQVENCVMELSPGLARRISVEFGLDPNQLMAGPTDQPERPRFAMTNIAFTKEGYEAYKTARLQADRDEVDKNLTEFSFILEVLLDAANETQRYRPFVVALTDTLKKLALEISLAEQIGEILVGYGVDPACRYDPVEVLFYLNRLEAILKNRDRARPGRFDEATTTTTTKKRPPQLEPIPVVITPQMHFEARQRSSPAGKSPKTSVPQVLPPDRDNAEKRHSTRRRGPFAR